MPVRGGVTSNGPQLAVDLAERGVGLAYVFEPAIKEQLRTGRLKLLLELYAAKVPGFFLYYPSRAQSSPALRLFVEVAKEVLSRRARVTRDA